LLQGTSPSVFFRHFYVSKEMATATIAQSHEIAQIILLVHEVW